MAIKQDRTERAYNYCEFVQFEKLLNGILEFANKQKLYTLSTKIGDLMVTCYFEMRLILFSKRNLWWKRNKFLKRKRRKNQ
jgi:hypothetical protein